MKERISYQEALKFIPKEPIEKYREIIDKADGIYREWWGCDKRLNCTIDGNKIEIQMGRKRVIYERV